MSEHSYLPLMTAAHATPPLTVESLEEGLKAVRHAVDHVDRQNDPEGDRAAKLRYEELDNRFRAGQLSVAQAKGAVKVVKESELAALPVEIELKLEEARELLARCQREIGKRVIAEKIADLEYDLKVAKRAYELALAKAESVLRAAEEWAPLREEYEALKKRFEVR
jgi:hypothetical protein